MAPMASSPSVSRRSFLAAGVSSLGAAVLAPAPAPDRPRTRLILLGTARGPSPKVGRAAPPPAHVVGDRVYLVGFGDRVPRQLAPGRLPFPQLRAVFLTHQHSDHNAGYGPLLLLGWTAGLTTVDTYGPPPLEKMTRQLLDAYAFDIETRIADEGRAPLAPLVRPHDITAAGEIFKDDRVRVTAALNRHPPSAPSFASRVDGPDRSIVISGDTSYAESVVALTKGADVLVHEAMYRSYYEQPEAPLTRSIRQHIVASHTD